MDNRPIGVFDSGLGGLTVVKEIKKVLPGETIVYLGDTARVPYGTRSEETIKKFSLECANFLVKQNIKALVIACNTASAFAYEAIKGNISVPVFEVISWGARGSLNGSKKIGVIGTEATIKSEAYEKAIRNLEPEAQVMQVACRLLVPLVEAGEVEGELINLVVGKYVKKIKNWGAESVILGCTHYPVITGVISGVLGREVKMVNPAEYLALGLADYLKDNEMLAVKPDIDEYYFTDIGQDFLKIAERFLGVELEGKVEKVNLE